MTKIHQRAGLNPALFYVQNVTKFYKGDTMKIRFVAAVVMAQVITHAIAMEQQQHDSEQARTKAVLEIFFKRMVLVVDNAQVIPVFKNLQLTTKMGTNKDFLLPYLKNALMRKNKESRELKDAEYKVGKAIRREEKDRKYDKYYARQQEALHIAPDDYDTWSDFTPGKLVGTNKPSVNELEQKKLLVHIEQVTKEIRFLEKRLGSYNK